jgi:hypothetical protein
MILQLEIRFPPIRQVYRRVKERGEELGTAYCILEVIGKVRMRLTDMETP